MRLLALAATLIGLMIGAVRAETVENERATWLKCLDDAAAFFGEKTQDPADVVAAGVFGACEPQESNYFSKLQENSRPFDSPDAYFASVRQIRDANRDHVIFIVLKARAGLSAGK
jgi:hypothetical protein